jgi:hypothetical protein
MLARFAHDLEITTSELAGHATLEGEGFSAELSARVASLRVAGVLRDGRVDPSVLSTSDRADIERKLRDEVFPGTSAVRVLARGASRARADVTVEIASGRQTRPVALEVQEEGDRSKVSGRVELSMKRLGMREVKAPLGAFRVSDGVEVLFDLTLRPEG